MLPLVVDYVIFAAVVLAAFGLTLWARGGDPRAARWGRGLARFCYGPAIYVFLLDPIDRLSRVITDLDIDIHATPNAPLSAAADSVHALTNALRIANWLPLIITVGIAIY